MPFIAYDGREWTYKEVYETVLQYAAWMKAKYSLSPKEVVAMDYMNSAEFLFLSLAIWSLGARPALINYNLTGDPLLHCLRTSTARIVIIDDEVQNKFGEGVREKILSPDFRDGQGAMDPLIFDDRVRQEIETTKGIREPDEIRSGVKGHEMACLIYTSGTTGLPKPGIVVWNKLMIGGTFGYSWLGLKLNDRFYTVCLKTICKLLSTKSHLSVCPYTTPLPTFWASLSVSAQAAPLSLVAGSARVTSGMKPEHRGRLWFNT